MLIVALYMNEVPIPSAQVMVPNANRRFSWDGNLITVPSLITQCIHNPSPCCFIWASLTTSSTKISTYGSFFKSLKSQVSAASLLILLLSRHFAPSLLSPGNEVVASVALLTSGTWAKKVAYAAEPFPQGCPAN